MTEVYIGNEKFGLLAERALYRFSNQTLMVADLHWGKAEVFQKSGVAVSSSVLDSDLERLSRAILSSGAKRLVVLGDLIHSRSGVTADVSRKILEWRSVHSSLRIELVRGNHDRAFRVPFEWQIHVHDGALEENGFFLVHDPHELFAGHTIGGHVHPVLKMQNGADSLRLACFALGKTSSLVPAFSEFTGGFELKRKDWLRLFVVARDSVIEV